MRMQGSSLAGSGSVSESAWLNLTSIPGTHIKKPGTEADTYNPVSGEADTGGPSGLDGESSLAESASLGFSERPFFKK